MPEPATKPCDNCTGTGLVLRPVEPLAENDHVKRFLTGMPSYGQETCGRCGGTGRVRFDPATVTNE